MTNDTIRTMPTVEEIEAMAEMVGDSTLWPSDIRNQSSRMLRAIADQMRKSDPVAWLVKINGSSICVQANPEAFKTCGGEVTPLYTVTLADAEDARRYRYIKSQMETGAVQTLLPLHRSVYWIGTSVDCDDVNNVDEAIDAAMKEDSHDHPTD